MNLDKLSEYKRAKLYLWAAGHYLSSWPVDWDGNKLELVLSAVEGDDEFPEQEEVEVWDGVKEAELEHWENCNKADDYIDVLLHSLDDVLDILEVDYE